MSIPVKRYLKQVEPHLLDGETAYFACRAFDPPSTPLETAVFGKTTHEGIASRVPKGSSILGFTGQRLLFIGVGLRHRGALRAEFKMNEVAAIDAETAKIKTGSAVLRFVDGSTYALRTQPEESRALVKYLESSR